VDQAGIEGERSLEARIMVRRLGVTDLPIAQSTLRRMAEVLAEGVSALSTGAGGCGG
jgi:hypothetical protein